MPNDDGFPSGWDLVAMQAVESLSTTVSISALNPMTSLGQRSGNSIGAQAALNDAKARLARAQHSFENRSRTEEPAGSGETVIASLLPAVVASRNPPMKTLSAAEAADKAAFEKADAEYRKAHNIRTFDPAVDGLAPVEPALAAVKAAKMLLDKAQADFDNATKPALDQPTPSSTFVAPAADNTKKDAVIASVKVGIQKVVSRPGDVLLLRTKPILPEPHHRHSKSPNCGEGRPDGP